MARYNVLFAIMAVQEVRFFGSAAKRRMKSFGATDFMAVFGKLGRHNLAARDVPLASGYLPLYRSHAVVVRPARVTTVSST